MKLFTMKDWVLHTSEEVWGLSPFKKILSRDKTKDKEVANAEMLFIWYWCDIKSNYIMMPEIDREKELKKDIHGLPSKWKKDSIIEEAIEFYKKNSESVLQKLYKNAVQSAIDVGNYLENTDALLKERDMQGKVITKISDITRGLKDVKIIMRDLKAAEKEVIKEQEDNDGKTKGSRNFNTFEDGITID